MNDLVTSLTAEQRKLVEKKLSKTKIMFGGGTVIKSLLRYCVPVRTGDISCMLWVKVIPGNLPLLLSLKSLRRAKANINLAKSDLAMWRFPSHF